MLGGLALTGAAAAQRHTYANPVDIDYRYNFEQINEGVSYRTPGRPRDRQTQENLLSLHDAC